MKTQQLIDSLLTVAKDGIRSNIESSDTELLPTMIVLTKDNKYEIYGLAADKTEIPKLMKMTLTQREAKAYVLVLEAWITPFYEEAARYNWNVRDMPDDDKSEVAQAMLVTKDGGCTGYSVATIEHSKNGRVLQEWKDGIPEKVEGPFIVTDW